MEREISHALRYLALFSQGHCHTETQTPAYVLPCIFPAGKTENLNFTEDIELLRYEISVTLVAALMGTTELLTVVLTELIFE